MSEVTNLKDVLKASPRSKTYANAIESLGPLYKGSSQPNSYVSLADKLKENSQQNFCIACAIAGQPCLEHLKKEAPIMSVDDVLGSVSQYASSIPQFAGTEKNSAVHPKNGGVYLIVDLSNPENYVAATALLKAVAQYYASQSRKTATDARYIDTKASYAGAEYKGSSSYTGKSSKGGSEK